MQSWNTSFIISKKSEGVTYYLLVRRKSKNPQYADKSVWGFPGGGNEPGDRDFVDTGQREVWQETGLLLVDHRLISEAEVCRIPVDDHLKISFHFPFESFEGELRTEIIPDGEDELFPPEWVRADEVGRRLYRNKYHQRALLAMRERETPLV